MKKNTISVTSIVKNEEKWVWYSIMSVIKHVDNILVYDTGSTDNTVEIIKSIDDPKIGLKLKGKVDSKGFIQLRQEQLQEIDSDWVLILDGDEIYPEDTIKSLTNEMHNAKDQFESLALRFYNCVGDVYHYNPKGGYTILGETGNLTIRAFKRDIPGLHCDGLYDEGTEGFFDCKNMLIQDRKSKIKLLNKFYFHMHSLPRTSIECKTMRRDLLSKWPTYSFGVGKPFNKDIKLPEVFYINRPTIVTPATERLSHHLSIRNFLYAFYYMKMCRFYESK